MSVNREGLEKLDRYNPVIERRVLGSPSEYATMEKSTMGWYFKVEDVRALLAEAREEGKPICTCPQIETEPWVESTCPVHGIPASAGTEGPGLMEILRKWQVAFDHFLADPGQFLDVFKEPIRLTQLALAARPPEGEKK